MGKDYTQEINTIVADILADYEKDLVINHVGMFELPDAEEIKDILNKLFMIVYPGFFRDKSYRYYNISSTARLLIEDVIYHLNKQIPIALSQLEENAQFSQGQLEEKAQDLTKKFFDSLPKVRELVDSDVRASYDGDPASFSHNEIVLCYPGLRAITTARIAHELHLLGIPLIPRMMTEIAHSETGIDIHPGASIGKNFCIDHGTGIVIGETTVIGENVKIYQGVTIGALSTRGGQSLRGTKRHPTIEDNVTIYAGASILGGETVIGHDAVIGSNAFITSSVCPGTKVSIKNQELNIREGGNHDAISSCM